MAVVHQDSSMGMLLPESLMFTLNISGRQPLPHRGVPAEAVGSCLTGCLGFGEAGWKVRIYLPEKVVNSEFPRPLCKMPANSPDNSSAPVQTDICAERERWAFAPRVVTTDHRARARPTLIPCAQGSKKKKKKNDHRATGRGA